jgi:hypothetical protein
MKSLSGQAKVLSEPDDVRVIRTSRRRLGELLVTQAVEGRPPGGGSSFRPHQASVPPPAGGGT